MKNKKAVIKGWLLDYGQKLEDVLHWKEGNGGVEYAVVDHFFRGKKAVIHNLPFTMKDSVKYLKITIEEIGE